MLRGPFRNNKLLLDDGCKRGTLLVQKSIAAKGLGRFRREMMMIKKIKCIASTIWIHVCCHSTYYYSKATGSGTEGVRLCRFCIFGGVFFFFR